MNLRHKQRGFVRPGGSGDDTPRPVVLTVGWMRCAGVRVARYRAEVVGRDGRLYSVWWAMSSDLWRCRGLRVQKYLEGLEQLIRVARCGDSPLVVKRRDA